MDIEIKLAWLAGIIEGEGCFSINSAGKNRNYFVYCISITNTDLVLLDKCSSIMNEISVSNRIKGRNKIIKNRRFRYDIKIEGINNMILLIDNILPYIYGEKKLQAELMLSFLKRRNQVIKENVGKSPRRRAYDNVDHAYLNCMKKLKSISESVETRRLSSRTDEDIVRTACIYKDADLGRNDLSTYHN